MRFWEGHAPHTVSLTDSKFDPQVHVLCKKASWTIKVHLTRLFFAKNSKINRTFERLISFISRPHLLYGFEG